MKIKLNIPLSLSKIKKITGASGEISEREIEYIATDSREASENTLFIALPGEKYDGEDFVGEAEALGAAPLSKARGLKVEDTKDAFLALAAAYKKMLPKLKHTISVTGSVGKSGTKEFLYEILKKKYKVHKTPGNFNNEIGLPLTILSADADTEILILEMGMNAPGEIRRLSLCAEPDIAVITNIGSSHIGRLGSRENIALAKLEILSGMSPSGKLAVPFGEPLLSEYGDIFTAVGDSRAEINITPEITTQNSSEISVCIFGESFSATLALGGVHHLENLSASLGAVSLLGLSIEEIKSGISDISGNNIRQKTVNLKKATIIDDSYNASEESVRAAFSLLKMREDDIKSALLSDILELGEAARDIHRRIGCYAAECGITRLYLFGEYSRDIAEGAVSSGIGAENIYLIFENESPEEFAERIYSLFECGEIILAKASHGTDMKRVLSALVNGNGEKNAR